MEKIKGVNLGNWLVLEKWMSPALFAGTTAEDEYYLPTQLSPEVYEARIKIHRSEYITERDFAMIRHMGLNLVRIPIPYFIFGDRKPFIGCIEELDHAFSWAEKYGIKILIDLHTAPGSQNGFDNGGICGVCMWSQMPEEVEFELTVLERLAQRYGKREGLFGITPINEPILESMWETMDVQHRYVPVNPEWSAASKPNTHEFLESYYEQAYDRMRPYLLPEKYVVFHDAFELKSWKDFVTRDKFKQIILDTHNYLMVAEMNGCPHTLEGYTEYIEEHFAKDMAEVQAYVPVICGEWCLFNSLAAGRDTGGGQAFADDGTAEDVVSPEEKKRIYNALAKASFDAWNQGSGYVYWSYKLLLDTVNEPQWIGWDSWDLGKSFMQDWIRP